MRSLVLAVAAAGCGFSPGKAPGDTPVPDDAVELDAFEPDGATVDVLEIDAPAPPIELRQINNVDSGSNVNSIMVPFTNAQVAGDLVVVVVGWYPSASVVSVADTNGTAYAIAAGPTVQGTERQTIYYKCGIPAAAAGANTVTVTFATAEMPDVHVLEYSGVRASGCLDVASSMSGVGTAEDGGPLTTTYPHDLLVAATFQLYQTTAADPAYTNRGINNFGDLVEDREVQATGVYHALATQNTSGDWVMHLVAFKGM